MLSLYNQAYNPGHSAALHAMPISQNLLFVASVPKDTEFDHPPGAALVRRLASGLTAAGWSTYEMGNWRDCGWSVACRRGSSELEVVVSQIQDAQWMLQVGPKRSPGLIGSLFGGKPLSTPGDAKTLVASRFAPTRGCPIVCRLRKIRHDDQHLIDGCEGFVEVVRGRGPW